MNSGRAIGPGAGTAMVKDIAAGAAGSDQYYFTAYVEANGVELWKSDGTEQGTKLVVDVNMGSGNGVSAIY